MELDIDRREAGVAVARLKGNLDLAAADAVRRRLVAAIDEGYARLVVDLGGVGFIDSSGLSSLVGVLKAARTRGGEMRIANAPDQARLVLRVTTLDRILKPYGDVTEALEGYGRHDPDGAPRDDGPH